MTRGRQIRAFLLLSIAVVLASVLWSVHRWRAHGPERERWVRLTRAIHDDHARIDSLEVRIDTLRTALEVDKRSLRRADERIGMYEREAVDRRLPTPAFRGYQDAVERQNGIVTRHNEKVRELQELYARYSRSVDAYNARVDSANALQHRAAQEGFELPEADIP